MDASAPDEREVEPRINRERAVQPAQGLCIAALSEVQPPQSLKRDRALRFDGESTMVGSGSAGVVAEYPEVRGIPMMCLGVARVECDRPFERNPRALEGSRVADGQQRRLGHPGVGGVGVVSQRTVVSRKGARQEAL